MPTADPAFVWPMEDGLSVYARPYNPTWPVGCLDEPSRQFPADARPALPPAPGRPARHDPEYVQAGVADILVLAEPLRCWRDVLVSDLRTRLDLAACLSTCSTSATPKPSASSW